MNHDELEAEYERLKMHAALLQAEKTRLRHQVTPWACCRKMPEPIGEAIIEEIDMVPATFSRRRTVGPKCACGCGEAGMAIAPLPPGMIPHSKLELALAVYTVPARFDDHLSFYWLEQQFQERHGLAIPRRQMVQWVKQIALWLQRYCTLRVPVKALSIYPLQHEFREELCP